MCYVTLKIKNMNRDIKYRVYLKPETWDDENGLMTNGLPLDGWDKWWLNLEEPFNEECGLDGAFDIEGLIIMQYTGINDKKGKEIYEHDVVKVNGDEVGCVSYRDGCFWVMFYGEPAKEPLYKFCHWNPETDKNDIVEIEVIGLSSIVGG